MSARRGKRSRRRAAWPSISRPHAGGVAQKSQPLEHNQQGKDSTAYTKSEQEQDRGPNKVEHVSACSHLLSPDHKAESPSRKAQADALKDGMKKACKDQNSEEKDGNSQEFFHDCNSPSQKRPLHASRRRPVTKQAAPTTMLPVADMGKERTRGILRVKKQAHPKTPKPKPTGAPIARILCSATTGKTATATRQAKHRKPTTVRTRSVMEMGSRISGERCSGAASDLSSSPSQS